MPRRWRRRRRYEGNNSKQWDGKTIVLDGECSREKLSNYLGTRKEVALNTGKQS